jgi:hypothetical protein
MSITLINFNLNRKGAVKYFIILGLLVVVIYFFYTFSQLNPDLFRKGAWAFQYQENIVLEARKELVFQDSAIRSLAQSQIIEIARSGSPSCGGLYPDWVSCLNDPRQDFLQGMESSLSQKFSTKKFSSLGYDKSVFSGKGFPLTVKKDYFSSSKNSSSTKIAYPFSYTVPSDFSIDLNYDLTEYEQLLYDANQLLSGCREQLEKENIPEKSEKDKKLSSCVKESINSKKGWFIGSCTDQKEPLYELYLSFQHCLNTAEDYCYCPVKLFDPSEGKEAGQEHSAQLKLSQEAGNLYVSDSVEFVTIPIMMNYPSELEVAGVEYKLSYPNHGGQEKDYALTSSSLVLLKDKGQLEFVDLLENSKVRRFNGQESLIEGLHSCSLPQPEKIYLCVESPSQAKFISLGSGKAIPLRYRLSISVS